MDTGKWDKIFPGGTDAGCLNVGIAYLLFNQLIGVESSISPQISGIPKLNFIVIDPQVYKVLRLSLDDDMVVTSKFKLR